MILQRCQDKHCRNIYPLNVRGCPRCHHNPERGKRFLVFKKQLKRKRYFHTLGYSTLAEAETAHAEWIRTITQGPGKPEEAITVQEMADSYLGKLGTEGKTYRSHAKLFLDRLIEFCSERGIIRAVDMDAPLLNKLQTALRGTSASPAYVDRHFAIYRAAWYYQFGRSRPNPVSEISFYHPDNTIVRFLTVDEQRRLIAAAKKLRMRSGSALGGNKSPHFLPEMIIVALQTGMRATNIFNLHTDEVNFETGQITVTQKRDLTLIVEMNSIVRKTLKRIRPAAGGFFFENPRTGKPFKDISDAWEKVKAEAKITRPFRFHDLRHTFGTTLGEIADPRTTMEAMGHRSINTTMKYWHVRRERLRESLEELADRTQPKRNRRS